MANKFKAPAPDTLSTDASGIATAMARACEDSRRHRRRQRRLRQREKPGSAVNLIFGVNFQSNLNTCRHLAAGSSQFMTNVVPEPGSMMLLGIRVIGANPPP